MTMNIVHITATDQGGAGIACIRLHNALLDRGINSHILFQSKSEVRPHTESITTEPRQRSKIIWTVKRILQRIGIPYSIRSFIALKLLRQKIKYNAFATLPYSDFRLDKHPRVINADIIHLHWVANTIDYSSFFRSIKKPIVWTIHDQNIFLGCFHTNYTKLSAPPPLSKLDDQILEYKIKEISRYNNRISFVHVSNTMYLQSLHNAATMNHNNYCIPICLDNFNLKQLDRTSCRELLNISTDQVILLFVSNYINDPWKGFSRLVEAVETLKNPSISIYAVGSFDPSYSIPNCVKKIGRVESTEIMHILYSTCDFLISASDEESFGQTLIEANACGIPIISTPHFGALDIINQTNGIIADNYTADSLGEAIRSAQSRTWDQHEISASCNEKYSPSKISAEYIRIYEKTFNSFHNNQNV